MQQSRKKNRGHESAGMEEEGEAPHGDPGEALSVGNSKNHADAAHRLSRLGGPGSVTIPTFSIPAFLMASITNMTRP